MAVASDPTQFAATPNAAIANAAARRLAMAPSAMAPAMGGGGDFGPPPRGDIPPGQTLGGPLQNPHPPTPPPGVNPPPSNAGPVSPLSGGTGNADLDKYLGTDTTYQSQLSDLMRQYDQYNAQKNLQASQTQADYDAKQRALDTQSTQDRLNMRNADAARGILYSGIYANQLGQYNDANQQQITNLLGGLQNSKDSAQLAYEQFLSNELNAKAQAIQEAAARRAAGLGKF